MSQDDRSNRPVIECAKNGPYLVRQLASFTAMADGKEYETREVTALCRCGQSANKPYCDGSHSRIGFSDEKEEGRTPDRRESYVGDGVTIHDNRGICAHSGLCTDGLPSVFRLKGEPFVDAAGGSAAEIIEIVKKCPSGALSYSVADAGHAKGGGEPKILFAPNGPYAISGGAELVGVALGEGATTDQITLCRCGKSKNKPFCDGTHWNVKFDEHAREDG